MGIQKKLRQAAKANYARERGFYLSGNPIGVGMKLAKKREDRQRNERDARENGWAADLIEGTKRTAADVAEKLVEAVKPKRSRKKAVEEVVQVADAEPAKPKRSRAKKPVDALKIAMSGRYGKPEAVS